MENKCMTLGDKMYKGIGLVLTGGGGKGAYHIGVWKALREYGIDKNITAISGTSVGILNGILFAQGNYNVAETVWKNISKDKILKLDMKKIILKLLEIGLIKGEMAALTIIFREFYGNGIFSREGLVKIIDDNINLGYISNCYLDIFAAAYNINTLKIDYLKINGKDDKTIKKILLASSALPIIFDNEEIDGQYYIDGGVKDNVPIKPLYDRGIRNFIVVHLARNSLYNSGSFKDANIIEIVPSNSQGDLLTGTLDFSKESTERRIGQGYNDTIKILKPMYEMGIVQSKIGIQLQKFKKDEVNFTYEMVNLFDKREKIKDELNKLLKNH
ncbi:patatin-like phospholipase family protein [Clostridium ljungdahlii]|uniref:patatin-like phospholipase family protein n=1 Tax=Clostridium ljungdahlii TaxID=1538 RepID=UPI003866FC76